MIRREACCVGMGLRGLAVLRRSACIRGALAGLALWLGAGAAALAADRYAIVVSGASGGPQYAEKYDRWRADFVKALREQWRYPNDHVVVLAETSGTDTKVATRDNVRAAFAALRTRVRTGDVVVVLLIGHGAGAEGEQAKFNLVGPDMTAAEWAEATRSLSSRLVFIDTASGSFPFLETLAGRSRVVITANDNAAQQFETVMPEFLVGAFNDPEADVDKNGKTSLWEAFSFASAGVARWFQERGQLATERPLLDDTGDGVGTEANGQATDGMMAKTLYLQPDPVIPDSGNPEIDAVRRRRLSIEGELESLRFRRPQLTPEQYDDALEKLLLELAQIDRRLRQAL
ncbi:MAG: hypothetical protein ABL961_06115 [Vicinamibacterales bacterium]